MLISVRDEGIGSATESNKSESRGFFSIYKPGQGKYVRWGTVVGFGLLIIAGMFWVKSRVLETAFGISSMGVQTAVVVAFALICLFFVFMLVNRPRPAEFMIMTESEMRKVTWPSRQAVVNSTKVVVTLTLMLAIILWIVDFSFVNLFRWMNIS